MKPSVHYLNDTIGYHHHRACAFFGPESKPVKWLEKKAAESPRGMHEKVVTHETQVVYVLGQMWLEEQEAKRQEEKRAQGT